MGHKAGQNFREQWISNRAAHLNYIPPPTLMSLQSFTKYRVSQKKYPLLTGNRNKTIRYHYSPSGQLNLSIFNLDPHTLLLKIGHQTLEIQACKVKIYSAAETRGFVRGPSHDLLSQACCTGISTLTFTFLR